MQKWVIFTYFHVEYDSISIDVQSIVCFSIGLSWFLSNRFSTLPHTLQFVYKIFPGTLPILTSIVNTSFGDTVKEACEHLISSYSLKEKEALSSPVNRTMMWVRVNPLHLLCGTLCLSKTYDSKYVCTMPDIDDFRRDSSFLKVLPTKTCNI